MILSLKSLIFGIDIGPRAVVWADRRRPKVQDAP